MEEQYTKFDYLLDEIGDWLYDNTDKWRWAKGLKDKIELLGDAPGQVRQVIKDFNTDDWEQ